MKFNKYLTAVQRSSATLRHLNYKALKAEVKRLRQLVDDGKASREDAAECFAKQLGAELSEVERCWESCLRDLKQFAADLFSHTDMVLWGDVAHDVLNDPLVHLELLEPFRSWLSIAALADGLRKHRLLQITAVVKIEKKFVKVLETPLHAGHDAVDLIRCSALSRGDIHTLCAQLEAGGDAMLRLGLGTSRRELGDPCSICLGHLVDPARLPCGHRFCIHCVLPLFDVECDSQESKFSSECDTDDCEDGGMDAALLKCPLCRARGPALPQALRLDGLVARIGRGLSPQFQALQDSNADDSQHFTAVVVSSLARLAARSAPGGSVIACRPCSSLSQAPEPSATCRSARGLGGGTPCSVQEAGCPRAPGASLGCGL